MRWTVSMLCCAYRDSACILVFSVSNGCDASGETSPKAMPLMEPYTSSSVEEPVPTMRPALLGLSPMTAWLACVLWKSEAMDSPALLRVWWGRGVSVLVSLSVCEGCVGCGGRGVACVTTLLLMQP